MNKTVLILIIILAVVIIAFLAYIFGRVVMHNKRLEKEIVSIKEVQKKKDEQIKDNNKAKESIDTGDSVSDFNASIDILSKLRD